MKIQFRYIYTILGSLLVLGAYILSDPDTGIIQGLPIGAGTIATILIMLKAVWGVGLVYISRLALVDYINLKEVFDKARTTAGGAGQVFVGISILTLAIALVVAAAMLS